MKNKKTLMVLGIIALIGVVGVTFAYFTTTKTFENMFQTKPYGTTIEETFTSPDNWTPGTTTPKKVEVTNTGEVAVAVRAKIEQTWTSKNGASLGLKQGTNTAAILNFPANNKWTERSGWYYYNEDLAPGAKTAPFLESVTFNDKITADLTCTGTTSYTCTSSGNGYDGAKYVLKITVETIQADAKSSWN